MGPEGNESGPTFTPALFYGGTRAERFGEAFTGKGFITFWVKEPEKGLRGHEESGAKHLHQPFGFPVVP